MKYGVSSETDSLHPDGPTACCLTSVKCIARTWRIRPVRGSPGMTLGPRLSPHVYMAGAPCNGIGMTVREINTEVLAVICVMEARTDIIAKHGRRLESFDWNLFGGRTGNWGQDGSLATLDRHSSWS